MQCDLLKDGLHKRETSSKTNAYIILSKVTLFILGHRNKNPQNVNIFTICKGEHGHVHGSSQSLLQLCFYFFATEFVYDIQGRTQNQDKHQCASDIQSIQTL